ncbi:MAG TPA: hypothetical protein VGC76_02190 [Pyrinomonadaceae bacterium]|jgi:hypothetical protein
MSNWAWLILLVIALTVLGLAALGLITKHFYWGSRGTPPLSSEQRRLQREEQERGNLRNAEKPDK